MARWLAVGLTAVFLALNALVADQAAQAVYRQHRGLAWREWVPLGMRQRELELAVRKPTAAQVARAKDLLAHRDLPDKLPHERTYAERLLQQQQEAPPMNLLCGLNRRVMRKSVWSVHCQSMRTNRVWRRRA